MFKRTITSIALISVSLAAIFILPVWAFGIICSIFIAVGLYEFFRLNARIGLPRSFVYLGIISAMALPYITYFYQPEGGIWEALFFIIVLIALFIIQFTRKENQNAVILISVTLFGIFYVGWFFTFLVKIRFLEDGHRLVAFLLLVTKAGDIGAFLVGSKIGRHKLIPRISPNKSIEGALGGLIFSLACAWLSVGYINRISPFNVIFAGALIGVFAQLGDLAESLIKRDCMAKDSGSALPGIGGFLDVIDSILFSAPIFFIFLTCIRYIN